MNGTCEMCGGTGEGSGGYKGMCGYCDATGEGTCSECGYASSQRNPPAACTNHGPSAAGLEQARALRRERVRA